ncbi:MAG TPA: 30S ribosomal protein S7 [Alphaproteobacteria bacterium]|nr:30S ribosomal protein S7 [Alphaproteobacteria bacterium]HCS22185.1 30S ribosomal protein S7 [Rhodospirillaceae bacterium]HRI76543.1 30S ribosomal protein S7 [Alphaproteobacteria bacterium]HRJ65835.1 30S ribosomal protein S7 [Alphaproteobacteria bacterium]
MSRRHSAKKREVLPDPKFNNVVVAKFMNCIMESGKKSVAENIVYGAFDIIASKTKTDPVAFFLEVLDKVKPSVEVKSRRVGGATYQVPVEVRPNRAMAMAMRWLKEASTKRNDKTMDAKLASELMDAHNERGAAVKKREDTHKMAEANKAFAHFRW